MLSDTAVVSLDNSRSNATFADLSCRKESMIMNGFREVNS